MNMVSVIIPVYNGAAYINVAIESVLEQTFKNVEIIVVDDGSTDDTKSILAPLIKAGQIKYFYHSNRGLSAARNTGIRAASGKYLKFLDCNDFLYPKQIQLQVGHLSGRHNVISITDHVLLFENGEQRTSKIELGQSNQLARMIIRNFMPVHSILVERNAVVEAGGFDEEMKALEDADLWLRLLLGGLRLEKIDYVGCCYRIHGNSLSADADKMFLMKCRISEKLNGLTSSMPKSHMDKDTMEGLLTNNFKLIEGCLARNLKPEQYLPSTLANTPAIYLKHKRGIRNVLLRLGGVKPYVRLKHCFNCLRVKNYRTFLLGDEINWRNPGN